MARAPTQGAFRPRGAGRLGSHGGRQRFRRRHPLRAWSGGPSATRASTWWTRRPVEERRRHGTSGSGRPAAACWPSVTPTTWCDQAGSPPCGRHWPTPTLWRVCSTSAPWTDARARYPVPAATRQLGFLPFGLSANLAVPREVFEAVHGFDEDVVAGRGRRSVLATATGGEPLRRGDRCRRRETRACPGPAHVPWCLGLRTVRARGSTCATAPRACGATFAGAAKAWIWLVAALPDARPTVPTPPVGTHVRPFDPAGWPDRSTSGFSFPERPVPRPSRIYVGAFIGRPTSCRHEAAPPP